MSFPRLTSSSHALGPSDAPACAGGQVFSVFVDTEPEGEPALPVAFAASTSWTSVSSTMWRARAFTYTNLAGSDRRSLARPNERTVLSEATTATREPRLAFPRGGRRQPTDAIVRPSYVPRDERPHRELRGSLSNDTTRWSEPRRTPCVRESGGLDEPAHRGAPPCDAHPAKGERRRERHGSSFCSRADPV